LLQLGPRPLALYGLYRLGLATGHYRRMERAALHTASQFTRVRSPLPVPPRPELLRTMGKAGATLLFKEADEITRGKVRLFGGAAVPLHLSFHWPLKHWIEYETGRAQLPSNPAAQSQASDLKFVWEPARFGWAFTLGRAFVASENEKYARAFWKYFEEFTLGNPAYLGPHWMNGQEVAIRLLALVWSAQIFEPAAASTPQRRFSLVRSIAQHAARIPATLVYARSQNNNHLITEAAALFTAGVALDYPAWRRLGWHWLNQALRRQIGSYGEYIQHSTNYHRLMLQTVLWVDAILRGRGNPWPSSTWQALARASHWLFSMLDPASGHVPNLGANDGALILPLSATPFNDYRPTVQAAARAFLRTSLAAGPWDELPLWLGLPAGKHTADSQAYAADHLRGRDSWAYLRASQFKSRLSHMDQLHLDLWWRGLNLAQDAGTYLYTGPSPWDNPLVSARVHNTVTMDGRDPMTRAGRFLTLDWFPAYSKNMIETGDTILGSMLAHHKGFRRFGVRHERMVRVFRDEHWEVRDSLVYARPGPHNLRLHWLLPDWGWKISAAASQAELRLKSPHGWIRVILRTEPALPDLGSRLNLVRAGQLRFGARQALSSDGWASPTYGVKVPALSLALELESAYSLSFVTEFVLPRKASTQSRSNKD
jgi:hypothetical protein